MGRRGLSPRQLIELYYMLNENPTVSNENIAEELGVSIRKGL